MLPSLFKPQTTADFIGPAANVAEQLDRLLVTCTPSGAPLKILFLGKPGIGKTELANYVMRRLGTDRWHTTLLNGTQVGIDQIEDIARSLHYKDLFGAYRVVRF